jgi:acyl-CoA reductase-like NAD-dependent aldehyde dehydrogenase
MGEIWPVCEKLRWTIAHGERYLVPERVSAGLFPHKRAMIEYHPRGVVAVIAPWNYPLQNVFGPVVPALMAGNSCVIKVSEAVAWSAARIEQIFAEALQSRGLPRDLVQLVNGYGDTGEVLARADVDLIIFTGSPENGRRVIAASAERITPVILELGGKDPMIVCDDADLEEAVHAALAGVLIAAGQNCMAAERILVFDGIYAAFVARVCKLFAELRQGPPLSGEPVDLGAIVTPSQLDRIESLVNDAVAGGAVVLCGGRRREVAGGGGQYFEPTILTDVREEMAIAREETFGPVMVIMRVAGEEQAVNVANRTEFGLSSSVFTRDRQRAARLSTQLLAGSTCVNGFGLTYMAQELPFGGIRGSGYGRLNGREGLRACTNTKAVLYDRVPMHRAVRLFPVRRGDYQRTQAILGALYRRGLRARAAAMVDLLRLTLGG